MRAAKQHYRVALDEEDVCSECGEDGEGLRVTYHVSRGQGPCQEDTRRLTLIMDQENSVTWVRARHHTGLSLLAGLGGLWSLVTGVSLVSVLELVYWLAHTFYNHLEVTRDEEKVKESENPSQEDEAASRPRSAWSDDIPEEVTHGQEETSEEEESVERVVRSRPKSAWRGK